MLADDLTLLDGTRVISAAEVTKITGDQQVAADLLERVAPETILQGTCYYAYTDVLTLVEGARGS